MSRRVRHTIGIAEEARRAGLRAGTADFVASSWNASFHGFSADDRARILALALPAGIVYAQQLPNAKPARKNDERPQSVFSPFLNGQAEQLQPTEPKPITCLDNELDRWQREAVAKALATPDLFLLRGHPGSGKSRVLVEIIRQAIERGDRTLLVSKNSAALDRVLTNLSALGESLAVRCHQPGENEVLLRPEIRASLLETRASDLATRARHAGQLDLEASKHEYQAIDRAQDSWPVLMDLVSQRLNLETRRQDIEARRTKETHELSTIVESPETPAVGGQFGQVWSEWMRESTRKAAAAEATVVELERALEEAKAKRAKLQSDNEFSKPLFEARTGRRFWTPAWWSALLKPAETRRAAEIAQLLGALSPEIEEREKKLAAAVLVRQQTIEANVLDRTQLLDEERLRREKTFSAEIAELDARSAALTNLWDAQVSRLPALAVSSIVSQDDLARAGQNLTEGRVRAQAAAIRAEQWLALLDQHPQALRDALIENAPLVAATTAGWAADRVLAARLSTNPFDLLILEDAEQFTEAESASYAQLARRWLFVGGDYLLDHDLAAQPLGAAARHEPAPTQTAAFFGLLWQRLHSNPERLPYSWAEAGDKLICRLRPLSADQQAWVETERLADHPQIVLHILALPRSQPVVAEVVFPAGFTIQKAKQFILQELEELAVHAPARSMRWQDDHSDRLVLQLAGQACHHPAAVVLAPGIREMLNPRATSAASGSPGVAWQTCCIEFDRQSGWQRGKAEEWIERYLGLRDIGRTFHLDGLHRYPVSMGAFVTSLVSSQTLAPSSLPEDAADAVSAQCVEFVAVPPMAEGGRSERIGASLRLRSAGFELDLNEPKQRDRLSADLRAGLATQGFVNLSEARAIVGLLVDCQRAGSLPRVPAGEIAIFIVALYEAQAELIRRLLRAATSLTDCARSIEIGAPQTFAHREAPWVLVSLTRSHSHRATVFGSGPKELLLALSRARLKMFVFGDPGALARRASWEGAVERSDPFDANQERDLVRALVARLLNPVPPPTALVGSEGSGS